MEEAAKRNCVKSMFQEKYSNLENLSEDNIEEILLDLEKTLKEVEEMIDETPDDMEVEKQLREYALKSMNEKGNGEDLIELSLKEEEKQSFDQISSEHFVQKDGMSSNNLKGDAGHPAIRPSDMNNNGPLSLNTVYNKVASIRSPVLQSSSGRRINEAERTYRERSLSLSSISDSEFETPRSSKKVKKFPKETRSNYCRTVLQYDNKLQICTSYETKKTVMSRRSRIRERSSSLESRRNRRHHRKRSRSREHYRKRKRSRSPLPRLKTYSRSPLPRLRTHSRSPSSEGCYTPSGNIIRYRSRSRSRVKSSYDSRSRYRSPSVRLCRNRERSSSRESFLKSYRYKRPRSPDSPEELRSKKKKKYNRHEEIDLRRVLNYYKTRRASKEEDTPKSNADKTEKSYPLFENYWSKSVINRIGLPGSRVDKETMTEDTKDPPIDHGVQTTSPILVDVETQTLPCIVHQAVEEVIEIFSDVDEGQNNEETTNTTDLIPTPSNSEDGSVILKITFQTILNEPRTYFTVHQQFLEYLEDILTVPPFFKASYFHNYLYIWSTKHFGKWIMDFLGTFKYQQYPIISLVFNDKPPESSEYFEIKQKPVRVTDSVLSQIRSIFIVISGMQGHSITNTNYKLVIENIRKYTSLNENLKNILQDDNIVYTNNKIKVISESSMEHIIKFKDLVSSYHGHDFLGLNLNVSDDYVKFKIVGVTYETTIQQLDTVLNYCTQNTPLKACNWFVAEYQSPSIFIYVPKNDADFIIKNPKFLFKGKFVIIFEFVE